MSLILSRINLSNKKRISKINCKYFLIKLPKRDPSNKSRRSGLDINQSNYPIKYEMKNLIKYKLILIIIVLVGVVAIYLTHRPTTNEIESRPKLTFSEGDITLVKTLKAPDSS